MNLRTLGLTALLLTVTPGLLPAYVQRTINNIGLHRPDFQRIQFALNSAAVPGLTNASGNLFIHPDSNVVGAIKAAMDTWNHVAESSARFAPLTITSDLNNEQDNKNVIVFRDTPEIRSLLQGDTLAITDTIFNPADGTILDSDILFNPALTFSTTLTKSTYDIQAIATHEFGHALSANHTGILGATMFQTTTKGNAAERSLSSDEVAFVASVYPSNLASYGTLTGSVDAGGSPVRGALITAVERTTGVTVGGLSDLGTARFAMNVPPGNYTLYAEPLNGPVTAADLYISSLLPGQGIDTNFRPGPVTNAPVYSVSAGSRVNASISVQSGTSNVQFNQSATGPAGGHGDTFMIVTGPQAVHSGGATDLLLYGPGIDTTLTEQQMVLLGPATIRPGSLRRDDFATPTIMRLTLDVPARSSPALASLLINKNGATAAFSGGLILLPPAPAFASGSITNAFSGSVNGIAPGEDVSIYGTNLGPAAGVGGSFDVNAGFAASVGGVSVTFDGIAAPLLYVSGGQINAQAPFELAGKSSTNIVVSYNGAVSASVTAPVVQVHPGIYPKAINDDNSLNSASSPTQAGKYITIYALGLGTTTNQPGTGGPAPGQPLASITAPLTVSFGSTVVKPYFAGLTPGYVGLYQINVQVPQGLPTGTPIPLMVNANGVPTQSGVNLYLK